MLRLAEPHAGVLVDRFAPAEKVAELRETAARLPHLALDVRETGDLELIATGAASPLTGFLGHRDYKCILERLRLANGTAWPIPFTLAVTIPQMSAALRVGAVGLCDPRGALRAVLTVADAFVRSPRDEAKALYGSEEPSHPGVRYLLSRPVGVLGGPVSVFPGSHGRARRRPAAPSEVRAMARRRGWDRFIGLATEDGTTCLEAAGRDGPALLAVQRVPVRNAPDRDALLQAIVFKNYGAREVLLEYQRSPSLAISSHAQFEEIGITPVWLASRRGHARVASPEADQAVA